MEVLIGTSGWTYDDWRSVFYSPDLPKNRWLSYYMRQFPTVELNASFYRSLRVEMYARWYDLSPPGFIWSVKVNRFITHIKQLTDCDEAVQRFLASVAPLKEKLGPLLVQLPPRMDFNREALVALRQLIPPPRKLSLEARNKGWITADAFDTLKALQIAWCISDTAGRYPYAEEITADFTYIRLHGSQVLYRSSYTEEELYRWAENIATWGKDAFVYFDNDYLGHAPCNAARLKALMNDIRRHEEEQ